MARSSAVLGTLLVGAALLAGGLVSFGLYHAEQAARASRAPAGEFPTLSPAGPPTATRPVAQDTPTSSTIPAQQATPVQPPAAAGQAIYAQLCDACHPGGGAGVGPGLNTTGFIEKYAEDTALVSVLREGTPRMPAFPASRLSEAQLADLIAFVRTLGPEQVGAEIPTPTEVAVEGQLSWTGTYATDVQPIFDAYCARCHGETLAENGLRLDSYEGAMRGTLGGQVVIPGRASASTLVWVIQGLAAQEIRMPHAERPLSPNRIQNIVLWIDAGALER